MKIELSRFKVKAGKSEEVDKWLSFLNDNIEDTLLTLDNEKMYVETIFREKINNEEFLYWFSIQGYGGADIRESESYIDKKHLEYWDRCIDKDYKGVDIPAQVIMIPHKIKNVLK